MLPIIFLAADALQTQVLCMDVPTFTKHGRFQYNRGSPFGEAIFFFREHEPTEPRIEFPVARELPARGIFDR